MDRLIHIPIDAASIPHDGEVMLNKFWCVHPEKGLAFWNRRRVSHSRVDDLSPQCNADKRVSDHIVGMHKGHAVQQIPAVYMTSVEKVLRQRELAQ